MSTKKLFALILASVVGVAISSDTCNVDLGAGSQVGVAHLPVECPHDKSIQTTNFGIMKAVIPGCVRPMHFTSVSFVISVESFPGGLAHENVTIAMWSSKPKTGTKVPHYEPNKPIYTKDLINNTFKNTTGCTFPVDFCTTKTCKILLCIFIFFPFGCLYNIQITLTASLCSSE